MKIKVNISDTFKTELKEYAREICREGAIQARDTIVAATREALQRFYVDYDPLYYDRTYGMLSKSYSPYWRNDHNKKYFGGVVLSPDRLVGNYHCYYSQPLDPEIVFSLVYFEGSHGKIENFGLEPIPKMKPTPYELILEAQNKYIKNLKNNKSIFDTKGNYTTIRKTR